MKQSNIKYINYNITREDVVNHALSKQSELLKSSDRLLKQINTDLKAYRVRFCFDALGAALLILGYISDRALWVFLLISSVHLARALCSLLLLRTIKRAKILHEAMDYEVLPANIEDASLREILDLCGSNDKSHWFYHLSAIYEKEISEVLLDDESMLHIVYPNNESCVLKTTLVREGDLNCITITRGGIFVGNQTSVAKSSDMVTVLLN